jgi:hypothetical protein
VKGLLDPFLRSHFQVAFWETFFEENHQQALILPREMPCQRTKYSMRSKNSAHQFRCKETKRNLE